MSASVAIAWCPGWEVTPKLATLFVVSNINPTDLTALCLRAPVTPNRGKVPFSRNSEQPLELGTFHMIRCRAL